jgi:hypothetical protein
MATRQTSKQAAAVGLPTDIYTASNSSWSTTDTKFNYSAAWFKHVNDQPVADMNKEFNSNQLGNSKLTSSLHYGNKEFITERTKAGYGTLSSIYFIRFYRQKLLYFEVLWIGTLCSVVVGYQCFGGPCCLYLQGYSPLPLSRAVWPSLMKLLVACRGSSGRMWWWGFKNKRLNIDCISLYYCSA